MQNGLAPIGVTPTTAQIDWAEHSSSNGVSDLEWPSQLLPNGSKMIGIFWQKKSLKPFAYSEHTSQSMGSKAPVSRAHIAPKWVHQMGHQTELVDTIHYASLKSIHCQSHIAKKDACVCLPDAALNKLTGCRSGACATNIALTPH